MTVGTTIADRGSAPVEHHPLGVSTGVFEDHRGRWPELVAEAYRVSTYGSSCLRYPSTSVRD